MTSDVRSRSTRGRPAKPPLSAEAIVDAGLVIVRAEGLAAATMRRIASELDTGPASLYVYIAGARELHDAMLARVTRDLPLQKPDPKRWRKQVHTLLDGVLEVLARHPGLARVAVANPPSDAGALTFAEQLIALLHAGGIADQDAAWACDILPLLTTAVALETDAWRAQGYDAEEEARTVERMRAAFAGLSPAAFPFVTALADELTRGDGDERFHWAVDVLLDGMVARA